MESFKSLKSKQIIRWRMYRCLLLVKRNTALICGIALIVIPAAMHFTSEKDIMNTFYQVLGYETTVSSASSRYSVIEVYDDRYQLSENIDIIKLRYHRLFHNRFYYIDM